MPRVLLPSHLDGHRGACAKVRGTAEPGTSPVNLPTDLIRSFGWVLLTGSCRMGLSAFIQGPVLPRKVVARETPSEEGGTAIGSSARDWLSSTHGKKMPTEERAERDRSLGKR